MYCVITHRISMSLHVILCLSRSEASYIVFYTQHCREWACHMVFVTIRSLVYCFFTPDCREFACHSVFVTTRSVVCCLLHRIGWTWPVIMCACHNQKPRVFFFQQDCQELEFHSVFVTFRSLVKFVGPILRAACRSKSCCRCSATVPGPML